MTDSLPPVFADAGTTARVMSLCNSYPIYAG